MKVMVVDDSLFMRSIIKNVLTEAGITDIAEAADGEEAIIKYKELKPGLMFMDIMMPKKTGLEALKDIIAVDANAKIVMCTSVGQEKIVQEAVESGAVDFITKPFKSEDIKEIIAKYNAKN